MSEALPKNHHEGNESLPSPELHEAPDTHTIHHEKAPHDSQHSRHEQAAKAREKVAESASHQHDALKHLETNEDASEAVPAISGALRKTMVQRQLKSIQHKLPANERALSRLIHQPAIRAISEGVGKTVTRPSGLLGGGLTAFLGTTSYLYLAKVRGFTYNYLVFLLLFVGGFVIGLMIELIAHTLSSSRAKR